MNNLPKVVTESGTARSRTCDLVSRANTLIITPPGHTMVVQNYMHLMFTFIACVCVSLKPSVSLLMQIVEMMPHTENVLSFVEQLGDFYEVIDSSGADGSLKKRLSPHKPARNSDLVNGVRSDSDSSPETSGSSHSDLSTHTVIGVYVDVYLLHFCAQYIQCIRGS